MARISVHIVESPAPIDILNNRREGDALASALVHANVDTALYTVVNVGTFYDALQRVADAIHESEEAGDDLVPVLHLSMHGAITNGVTVGVMLTDGTILDWRELGVALEIVDAVITPASKSGLVVAMSTCHGFDGKRMAACEGKPSFYAIVGATKAIPWKDTVAPFVAFYHHVQTDKGTVKRGVAIMNDVLGEEAFDCSTASAAAERIAIEEFLADKAFWEEFVNAELRPELLTLAEHVREERGDRPAPDETPEPRDKLGNWSDAGRRSKDSSRAALSRPYR